METKKKSFSVSFVSRFSLFGKSRQRVRRAASRHIFRKKKRHICHVEERKTTQPRVSMLIALHNRGLPSGVFKVFFSLFFFYPCEKGERSKKAAKSFSVSENEPGEPRAARREIGKKFSLFFFLRKRQAKIISVFRKNSQLSSTHVKPCVYFNLSLFVGFLFLLPVPFIIICRLRRFQEISSHSGLKVWWRT